MKVLLVPSWNSASRVAESNPNGSAQSIAGIYGGPKKNVFGLMPHPERMSELCLGGVDGMEVFRAVHAA